MDYAVSPTRIFATLKRCPDCRYYKINVGPGGTRLRVAVGMVFQEPGDVRPYADFLGYAAEMQIRLQLFAPGDTVNVAATCEHGNGGYMACDREGGTFGNYAVELFANRPAAGVWTVRVIPTSMIDMAFRLRAKLEGPSDHVNSGSSAAPLSPNLRVLPPFEFSFNTPTATYLPGAPDTPGTHPSCMAEEVRESAEHGETPPALCLRYSMGVENAGKGPFNLMEWAAWRAGEASPDSADKILTQRRKYTDGSWRDDAFGGAGTAKLDPLHGHLHWQNAYRFQLYQVTTQGWKWPENKNRLPQLTEKGPGGKRGVLPGDEYMTDWHRFYHRNVGEPLSPYDQPRAGCTDPTGLHPIFCWYDGSLINIRDGWGDIYEWNRGGNYVDFPVDDGGNPVEGYYVLRGETDADNGIVETNETDNMSYALIEVRRFTSPGGLEDYSVTLLERGYGSDPWDPRKQVLTESP